MAVQKKIKPTYIKKRSMDWIVFAFLLIHVVFATKSFNYLSILDKLDMSNPMIVGELGYLRNQHMFHLMKNVMMFNQSICLSTGCLIVKSAK